MITNSRGHVLFAMFVQIIPLMHLFQRTEREEALLRSYYELVNNTILVHQHPVTGLLPSFYEPGKDGHQAPVCVVLEQLRLEKKQKKKRESV